MGVTIAMIVPTKRFKKTSTIAGLLLQGSLDQLERLEVRDDKHVVLIRVGCHGLQFCLLGAGTHADGEDGDAVVPEVLRLRRRSRCVVRLAVGDDDRHLKYK